MSDLDLFVCERLDGARLTRRGCTLKYRASLEHQHAKAGSAGHQQTHRCRGCAIGAAHDAGERPDVPLASLSSQVAALVREAGMEVVVAPELVGGPPRRAPGRDAKTHALDEREEDEMPQPPRLITVDQTERPFQEWIRELGVKKSTIYSAAKSAGISVDEEIANRVRARAAVDPDAEKSARSAPGLAGGRAKPTPKPTTPPLEQEVREVSRSVDLVELATRLGYVVEDCGTHPRGRLILVLED